MYSAWRIGVVFTAQNLTGGAFSSLMQSATTAQHSMSNVQSSMISMFGAAQHGFSDFGHAAVNAFMAAADAAGKYQLQMTLVKQQLNATQPTMDRIGATVTALSTGKGRTVFSRDQLVGMVKELQQSGLSADQIIRAMPQMAYGAEIESVRTHGSMSPEMFAKYLGSTIKGYGLADRGREAELAKFVDTYTRVASVTHLDASGLRTLEARVGGTARVFGVSATDFLESSGWMTQRGINPNEVGTIWRNILTNAIPHAGLTSHAANAQYSSLMMLGLLKPPNPADAKKYLDMYMGQQRALGFTALDPSKMSATAQNQFAEGLMRATTGSTIITGNMRDMFSQLHSAFERFRTTFGVRDSHGNITDDRQARQIFEQSVRQAFNLRGMQGALLAAFEGGQSYDKFKEQVNNQQGLTERANTLRYTYETMKQMLPKQFSTLLGSVGGSTVGGQIVAGSPLAIMTATMHFLTDFMGNLSQFAAMHPMITGLFGTLLGATGLAGLGVAGIFAATQVWMLNRAIIALGISSGLSSGAGAASATGRVIAGMNVGVAGTAAAPGLLARFAAMPLIASIGDYIATALAVAARVAFVGSVVGMVAAIIAAFVFVWKNPATVGTAIGAVIGFFEYDFIPATKNGLEQMKTAITAWWAGFSGWFSNLVHGKGVGNPLSGIERPSDVLADIIAAAKGKIDSMKPVVPPGHQNSHLNGSQTSGGTNHITINVNAPHANAHEVAKKVIDHLERRTSFALRAGGSSSNSPRMPSYASNGGTS